MADYDIGKAFDAIEQELISSMIRNMDRHRAQETREGLDWSMWQSEQLHSLEKYKIQNQRKYNKQFSSINSQVKDLIYALRQRGNMDQEIEILNAIKRGFTGAKKAGAPMAGEFFKLNDRKMEALINATTADMQRAETAILRMANDQYRKAIFNAQVYANSGAGTYEKAVDMATKNMLSAGLNCVEYANGARHTLADYADMAVRTANKRAYLTGEGEKRQEWGISTVIMNKRGNPCPKCLPFCGKILIDDVWSGGKASDGPYPLVSTAISAGLYHPRCRDSHTTYFDGIFTPPDDTFTSGEVEDIKQNYQKDQEQQTAKRQAGKFKRLKDSSLDAGNKKKYQMKAEEWSGKVDIQEIKVFGKEISFLPAKSVEVPDSSGFSPAKSLREAKEYAFGNLGVLLRNIDDIPLETINSINKQYSELLAEYPYMKGFVQDFDFTEELSNGTYAARLLEYGADGRINRSILFNKKEYMDMDALKSKITRDVKAGQFPKGTNVNGILDHEFGHCLADDMALRIRKININGSFDVDGWENIRVSGKAFSKGRIEDAAEKLKLTPKQIQGKISQYSKTDYSEAFAEAHSSTKGGKASKEALAVMKEYDRIKKIYIKGV